MFQCNASGNYNAKVGKEQECQQITGKHSKHNTSNENSFKLIGFAIGNGMIIKITSVPHKSMHKKEACDHFFLQGV